MPSSIVTAWKSDKGRRTANEDSALVVTAGLPAGVDALLIISDGMGGRASGAVASSVAVSAVRDSFLASTGKDPASAVAASLVAANKAVIAKAATDPSLNGMGATCVVVAVCGKKAYHAHMGDSRGYVLRDGRLRRLTEDHSFVAEKVKSGEISEDEARRSRFRNIITRAVGLDELAEPESGVIDLQDGDVLLLCTDGLSGPLTDEKIADIICSSPDADTVCRNLIDAALKNGGTDNVTVVLGAYGSASRARTAGRVPERGRAAQTRGGWVIPAMIALLIGFGLGVYPGARLVGSLVSKPEARTTPATGQSLPAKDPVYGKPVAMLYPPLRSDLLTLDGKGFLHVVDLRGQVIGVDTTGQEVLTSPANALLAGGESASSPKIASDRSGNIYISDTIGRRIVRTAPGGGQKRVIGEGQLTAPGALVVANDGSIYVIDAGRLKAIRPIAPKPTAAGSPGNESEQ